MEFLSSISKNREDWKVILSLIQTIRCKTFSITVTNTDIKPGWMWLS